MSARHTARPEVPCLPPGPGGCEPCGLGRRHPKRSPERCQGRQGTERVGTQDSDPVPGDLLGSGRCSEPRYIWGRLKRLEAWGPYPPRVESWGSRHWQLFGLSMASHGTMCLSTPPTTPPPPPQGPALALSFIHCAGKLPLRTMRPKDEEGFFFFSSKIEENRKRFLRQEEVFLSQVELRGKKRERKKILPSIPKRLH